MTISLSDTLFILVLTYTLVLLTLILKLTFPAPCLRSCTFSLIYKYLCDDTQILSLKSRSSNLSCEPYPIPHLLPATILLFASSITITTGHPWRTSIVTLKVDENYPLSSIRRVFSASFPMFNGTANPFTILLFTSSTTLTKSMTVTPEIGLL